jgi:hypothetical protein
MVAYVGTKDPSFVRMIPPFVGTGKSEGGQLQAVLLLKFLHFYFILQEFNTHKKSGIN